MNKIYLVVRAGPEWKNPIVAYTNRQAANRRAKLCDEMKDKDDPIERLSHYTVFEIEVVK